ncbi:FAD-binding protein [Streptomyces sp. NRRL B-1677]|uniref:FAD-binding protein n=1 Tax=Streptomyces sp. NRRL B-1677 TaxID=2682966 RepID=UPI001892951F|nr:FAD-binding protein [Streptomyces sp. NRRL B-1677]MBF6049170.1 FAD-binding protein [Streptomyces sp. NRRL B-1677]
MPGTAPVAFPGDPAYDAATGVFNLAAPARPAAALTATSLADVRAAISYASARGQGVRVHTTGHSAGAATPMTGAVLIRPLLPGGVGIDPDRRLARIPAGTPWSAVVQAAAAHGLAAPHGTSGTVGAIGYLLRGGVSFYGRKLGLAANHIRAVELITADGHLRRVSAAEDPGLFWAVRGGGGGFGVVTAVEIELFPVTDLVAGASFWSWAHAEAVVGAWYDWTLHAPDEVSTSLRVMNLPDLPEIPPMLKGGPVVCVAGVALAAACASDLLGPLRKTGEPVLDTWQDCGPELIPDVHMDPDEPGTFIGDHLLLAEPGREGIAAFLRMTGEGSGSPLIAAELRQLGGRMAVADPAGGVLNHLDARLAYMGAGVPEVRGTPQEITEHCDEVRAALSPWDTGRTAPGFVKGLDRPRGHLSEADVRAVERIRACVDPDGLFRGDAMPETVTVR